MERRAVIDHALTGPVDEFVSEVTAHLQRLSESLRGVKSDQLAHDVTIEAYNLVAAFIDADGRHGDDEVWALLTTFGPRMESMLQYATPDDVRKAGLLDGKRTWLDKPTVLFDILAKADAHGRSTGAASAYIDRALAIAHTVCSLDTFPAEDELRALERYRTMLRAAVPAAQPATAADVAVPEAEEEPLPPPRPLPELMAELDALVGLAEVKAEVKMVTDLIQVQNLRKERGLPVVEGSRHLVFTGNPGTGKTTVARLLAQIYRTLGVVAKGHLVETDRPGLVAGFVGQTALKVKEVFTKALGGFLLIDEAYALARGGDRDFGQEAIDTIVKLVEDHRDEIVVVAAGYPDEMSEFIDSNPGLRSRFPKTIAFPDYTNDELLAIFESQCKKASYNCDAAAQKRALDFFASQPRDKGFGNGRLARNLFEAAVGRQATRIVLMKDPTNETLVTMTADDIAPVPST
ncbi:MAG TPA: AAA family ATPase [Acidimicrobiales bacterium]|nr:AAA family ATPase [Acidimicrobiales bacterium]